MIVKPFDSGAWIERLASALGELAKAQEPFLQEYWRHKPRKIVLGNDRDETPFPLDDLRMVYAHVRHSRKLRQHALYEPLGAFLDPTRHALLSHPELERVAVSGRNVGENNFWMRILNSGSSISAGDLIAGLMARASEVPDDGFREAARELNAFLLPIGNDEAARVLRNFNQGCDALLFYGLTVKERIEVYDGMTIFPFKEIRRFVGRELVEELAPSGAGFHQWRSVGAVVRPFRWRPMFRRSGSINEPTRLVSERFFSEARILLDLIAVSHESAVAPLATMHNCIDRSAARFLGQSVYGTGANQKWATVGIDGFAECPMLGSAEFGEAKEAFRSRQSARFQAIAPFVVRLAEALRRGGRFAVQDKVVDVAIALEGMYELPKRNKSRKLEGRVSAFLGIDAEDRRQIRESVRRLYKARSAVVHSGKGETWPFRMEAAFVKGFGLARRSLFKLLRGDAPGNWDSMA